MKAEVANEKVHKQTICNRKNPLQQFVKAATKEPSSKYEISRGGEHYPFDKTKKGAEPEARDESVTREMPESSEATITDSGGLSAAKESCLISIPPLGKSIHFGVRFTDQRAKKECNEGQED